MPFSDKFRPKTEDNAYDQPYQAWMKQPTPETASAMLKSINPMIDKAVGAHVKTVDPGVRSRARRIALDSMRTWDPKKSQLQTYLTTQMQALKRYQAQRSPGISIPERISLDKRHLDEAEDELIGKLGRAPTLAELADHTHISPKRIAYVRGAQRPVSEGQMLLATENSLSPAVDQESDSWMELIYQDLDPTNQLIFDWTFGTHGKEPISNQEIARLLRVSPAAVSKRKLFIQKQLDEEDELSPF